MNENEDEPIAGADDEPDEVVLHLQTVNTVVEIAEAAGAARVNQFLDAGYVLLAIQQGSRPVPPKNATEQFTVRKFVIYVVGRPKDVDHFDPTVAA